MSLGALIRDLRTSRGWSQSELATQLCDVSGHCSLTREDVSRWERGKVIPGPYWLRFLSQVLDVPCAVLDEEARLSRVNRRDFITMSALMAAHGKFAAELLASIAGGDAGALAAVQTTHGTDLVIASLADRPSTVQLRKWMKAGSTAVLRVNATGILAKVPGQEPAADVARTLSADDEARHLYMTAVLARTCALTWDTAEQLAARPLSVAHRAPFVATRLASEALNPRDAGARWCAAAILRDLSPLLG